MNQIKNRVSLIGNLGMDPVVKEFQNGKKMARLSLATSDIFKSRGKRVSDTNWHRLVAWGKTAELIGQLLKKGSAVAVEGKLSNRVFKTVNGEKKQITEIVVDDFLMIRRQG